MKQRHRRWIVIFTIQILVFDAVAFSSVNIRSCSRIRLRAQEHEDIIGNGESKEGIPTSIRAVQLKKGLKDESGGKSKRPDYNPPKFSASFLAHMEEVKTQKLGKNADANVEGVDCDGEPPIDPSRLVQDDGIDSEFLSDYN